MRSRGTKGVELDLRGLGVFEKVGEGLSLDVVRSELLGPLLARWLGQFSRCGSVVGATAREVAWVVSLVVAASVCKDG